jgi:hypothetical protein
MKNLLESIRAMYSPQSEATMMQDDGKVVHNCAKHVEHAEWGKGDCISEEHAAPDADGIIAWYDVMFEHGLERQVPISNLRIIQAESHMHSMKKAKKVAEALNTNAPISIDANGAIKKKAMDAALAAANKQGPTGEIDKIVHQGVTKEAKEEKGEKLEDDEVQAAGHKKTKEKYETMSKMPERMKEHMEFSMTVEEFDQLDELSKQTLGSYVKKAKEHAVGLGVGLGVAAMKRRDRSDVADKLSQRTKNIDKAVDRITKEEFDVDEETHHRPVEYAIAEADKNYDAHFKAHMKKSGIKHPGELKSDEDKKAFFNKVDASFKAKNEDVFLEAYMASDLMAVKDAHRKHGNSISNEVTSSKGGQAHHSFVVTTPEGKRTRHIYHGTTKKVETMSAAPRSKQAKETGEDDDDK